jgi:hypothetical protein
MNTEHGVTPIKRNIADDLRGQLTAIAAKADDHDRAQVNDLVARATGALFSADVHSLTPGMCALLFLFHNSHNRPWLPHWTLELARRMTAGLWEKNSMTAGFYDNGQTDDGQHRFAAAALSNTTWTTAVVFGVKQGSVDTIDCGRRRSGADHAGLDGIEEAGKKQQIVKTAAAYFMRAGVPSAALRSEAEVKTAIEANDRLLIEAMEIGAKSGENISEPQLRGNLASVVAYVMMKASPRWPSQTIREKLTLFQASRGSVLGESDPFFLCAKELDEGRRNKARGEKLTVQKEIAVTIFALSEVEKGVKAIQRRDLKNALKKTLPDPRYPIAAAQAAA